MQSTKADPKHLQAAEYAAKRGDNATAFALMRQALLEDPNCVPAWLLMSTLVEDPKQQRECLERVLALDPQNETARDAIETLRLKELLSSVRAPALLDRGPAPRQIGDYLVEQRLISQDQLQDVLKEQRRRRQRGEFVQFGDLLLERRLITPKTLARALVAQLQERIDRHAHHTPQFLGEYLIAQGVISAEQLEGALEEQIQMRLSGKRIALGSLLIHRRYLSAKALQRVLEEQRSSFYNQMGD